MTATLAVWQRSWRADPVAREIADRHYNRQKVGAAQFVPPGRCLVLLTPCARALWVTSWPLRRYVMHRWAGAWVCSVFRNEGAGLSSMLIVAAVRETMREFPWSPYRGMVTFVDASKVRPKRDPGRCFLRAGFGPAGQTKGGLVALTLPAHRMPGLPPYAPGDAQPARCSVAGGAP